MKKKQRFATPDPEQDRKALREFYEKDYLPGEEDGDGIGPQAIGKLGQLVKVLKDLKKKR